MRVPSRAGVLLLAAVVASGVGAIPVGAQSPAPWSVSPHGLIRNAVDRLAALDAFAYRSTQIVEDEAPVESVMEVRRRPVPSVRFQLIGEGEIAYETAAPPAGSPGMPPGWDLCAACRTLNPLGARFCLRCGARIRGRSAGSADVYTGPPCPSCGLPTVVGADRCSDCGAPVDREPTPAPAG